MRSSEFRSAVRASHDFDSSSWGFAGALCYRRPVGWVLSGLLAESSSFNKGSYLWNVTSPLYVPNSVLALNWSTRLGSGATVYYTKTAELTGALNEFFRAEAPDEGSLLAPFSKLDGRRARIDELEIAGGANVLLDRADEARRCYTRILSHPDIEKEFAARHYPRIRPRVTALLEVLESGGDAGALLREQFEENRESLSLTDA